MLSSFHIKNLIYTHPIPQGPRFKQNLRPLAYRSWRERWRPNGTVLRTRPHQHRGPVSQQVWHDKDPSLVIGH